MEREGGREGGRERGREGRNEGRKKGRQERSKRNGHLLLSYCNLGFRKFKFSPSFLPEGQVLNASMPPHLTMCLLTKKLKTKVLYEVPQYVGFTFSERLSEA